MRLCVISGDYPSKGRPMYVFVEQLVNQLVSQGVEVSVIAPQSITRHLIRHVPILPKRNTVFIGDKSYIVYRPLSVTFSNAPSIVLRLLDKINYHGLKRIINQIDNGTPFVFYGHFWENAYTVRRYARTHGIPLFVACGEGDGALEGFATRLSTNEKKRFSRLVNGVISVSSANKKKCVDYGLSYEDRIIVLPNAIDTGLFRKSHLRNIREELGVKDSDFLIAYTGAFINRKGSSRLAEAISSLSDPTIKVMFIGRTRPTDDATPHCPGIVLKKELEHNEIPDYLFAADAFCLPSLNEGCSNAIVEAIACGLPVISSNLPFNDDILDESNSILINPLDVGEIASAIRILKDNKSLREHLSQGSINIAKSLDLTERAKCIIRFIKKTVDDQIN